MLVIPAIDLKNGNCVRLLQGDPKKETIYSENPVAMAKNIQSLGAKLIHVVDLDGAFKGKPQNLETISEIVKNIKIPIEIGGGIRSAETIEKYLDLGVKRIILGSVALEKEFLSILKKYSQYIVVGIDAKDGLVVTKGWKNTTKINAFDFIKKVHDKGVSEIIYTDIATDGMLTGPNYQSLEIILTQIETINLIASGGISSLQDMERLYEYRSFGLKGCIIGKAFYDGKIDLKEAIKKFGN